MKNSLFIFLAACLVGCANSRSTVRIVAIKETIWGVKVGQSPSGGTPAVQIGLVRSFWQEVPVGTNQIYAPDWKAEVDADVRLNHQLVNEHFGSGKGATTR